MDTTLSTDERNSRLFLISNSKNHEQASDLTLIFLLKNIFGLWWPSHPTLCCPPYPWPLSPLSHSSFLVDQCPSVYWDVSSSSRAQLPSCSADRRTQTMFRPLEGRQNKAKGTHFQVTSGNLEAEVPLPWILPLSLSSGKSQQAQEDRGKLKSQAICRKWLPRRP